MQVYKCDNCGLYNQGRPAVAKAITRFLPDGREFRVVICADFWGTLRTNEHLTLCESCMDKISELKNL